ncbi:MAG: gamma-glutamyl-gamma-aminobutyrate hydrolase family protein [Planctomycetes bacterium]|nr:gamma-glutamyl-gamma-aminobutyrate hydrolase family protein [Planctomycetota bacterium]
MKRATVLQHADHEDAGLIAPALAAAGIRVEHHRLHAGDPVPSAGQVGDIVVVMGGAMGVGDRADPRYRFLAQEIALLRELLPRDHPILGICLGAQLIAHAAGAAVYPNRSIGSGAVVREVGLGPVDLLARHDPAWAGLDSTALMLHWHGDTFDLPRGAVHLAASADCAHQAFRLGRRAYAFQFHCEVARDRISDWVREDAHFVELARGPHGAVDILAEVDSGYDEHRSAADRLILNVLTVMTS